VAVALEERRELVALALRVAARTLRERPQRDVHLGRRVVWEPAQHRAQLVPRRRAPEDPSGRVVGGEPRDGHRDEAGTEPDRDTRDERLERRDPLGRVRRRADVGRDDRVEIPKQRRARLVGSQHRAKHDERRAGAHDRAQHAERRPEARATTRAQPRVVEDALEHDPAACLHHRRRAGRQVARRGVRQERRDVEPEPHPGDLRDEHACVDVIGWIPEAGGEP
jgi:hypothetical protein